MILVGDWAPGSKTANLSIRTSGYLLVNLEAPFLASNRDFHARAKAGPHLWTNSLPVADCNFVFLLANNHIMDYGVSGLETTLMQVGEKNHQCCGAGRDICDARQPVIVEDNGIKIGIIACCEAQFGVASPNSAGVAEFGPWVYRAIRDLRAIVDAVIVSVHSAVEDSPWPAPFVQELYRSYIDAGATVVHGHHAHVPQGYEACGDGVIFYGMGNFAIDPDKWQDYPNGLWSMGAEIDFTTKPLRWRLLTFEIRHEPGADSIMIEESTDEERASHLRYLELCNRPLAELNLFAGLWQEVALRAYYHYGAQYMRFAAMPPPRGRRAHARKGLSMLKHALLNRIPAVSHPSRHDFLLWYHMMACESHRQMLATALGILGGEIEDLRTEETRCLADAMMPWSVGAAPA